MDHLNPFPDSIISHAVNCNHVWCMKRSCEPLKALFAHGKECTVRVVGGCQQCMAYWKILSYHAGDCKNPNCQVPHCKSLQPSSPRISLIQSARAILRKHSPPNKHKSGDHSEQKEDDIEDELNDARPESAKMMGCLITFADSEPKFIAENPLYQID